MSKKSYSQFRQSLDKEKLSRIYLFQGPQIYQKKEALDLLCQLFLAEGTKTFNLDQRQAPQAEINEIQNLAATVPWASPRRIVAVFDTDQYVLDQRNRLAEILPTVPDSTCLILLADKISEREALYKSADKEGEIVNFSALNQTQVVSRIEAAVKKLGRQIDPEAAEILAGSIGDNLAELNGEIEKLVTYLGEKKVITKTEVVSSVSAHPEINIFQLVDDICNHRDKDALETTGGFFRTGAYPGLITNQLLKDFFFIWRIMTYSGAKNNSAALAAHIGLAGRQFVIPRYLNCSRNLTLPKVESALKRISETESALRYGPLFAQGLIEELVLDLCRISGARPSFV
ncbi:MAG: DNA polymerase III subunit delta [candidate division Zixibacteria bacterium]|nr:DNA polymerase III subunit delta [candidate division Zixibacteria bacterium]